MFLTPKLTDQSKHIGFLSQFCRKYFKTFVSAGLFWIQGTEIPSHKKIK